MKFAHTLWSAALLTALVTSAHAQLRIGMPSGFTGSAAAGVKENTEGAKFWLKVFNDLKTRGVGDILIAVTDGLKGLGEALPTVFPATTLQTCIVHLIRNSLDFASSKDRKALAVALKPIYCAPSAESASDALDAFERDPSGQRFPTVVASWRRA